MELGHVKQVFKYPDPMRNPGNSMISVALGFLLALGTKALFSKGSINQDIGVEAIVYGFFLVLGIVVFKVYQNYQRDHDVETYLAFYEDTIKINERGLRKKPYYLYKVDIDRIKVPKYEDFISVELKNGNIKRLNIGMWYIRKGEKEAVKKMCNDFIER